jgi:hypothetical protein
MAHGTVRATAAACLGLIALQAVGTRGGSSRIAQLLGDANALVQRALDPSIPAIPDLANGGSWGSGTTSAPLPAGTWIDPVVTGQASADGSSGHNYNL